MQKNIALLVLIMLTTVACAASGKQRPPDEHARGPGGVDQPQLLLAYARDTQAKKGCKSALAAYRVIASFGDGYDIAQYELGACLMTIEATSEVEGALFAQEASFWLTRAAWAGNARAQLKLATALSGAAAAGSETLRPAPADAMKWALVFEQNSARALYNMKSVSPPVMDHLNAALDAESLAAAKVFADGFKPITMAAFAAPRRKNTESGFQQRQQPEGRQRKRRR